jgi:hypothetical protein
MSRPHEVTVTVTVDGDELDCPARCRVDIGAYGMGGAPGAELDGDPELFIGGTWLDAASLVDERDLSHVKESLCEVAYQDDHDACVESEDDQ